MFFKNFSFLILLFGGLNAFVKAQVIYEEPHNEPASIFKSDSDIRSISIDVRANLAQQMSTEHEKIQKQISNITATQNQILAQLSNLENQIPLWIQNALTAQQTNLKKSEDVVIESNYEPLRFHTRCGRNAKVTNDGRTALRPEPVDDYNFATVLTQRSLRSNELFEVRLERLESNWLGNLQIGVTIYSPLELDFPSDMEFEKIGGTWLMVFQDVIHNGKRIRRQYGENLNQLKVGDRAGVMLKENGSLHFFVNGVDQGVAARNVPAGVYGFIDLYGQAVEVSIVDTLK